MIIKLNKLTLTNFKGVRNLTIDFKEETNIFGHNGVGKSTIADSFFWLLFDKNSAGESDFEIKTLNPDNTPIHKLDHEVTGILLVDGFEHTLKKTYKERWVKKRGEEIAEFNGHETLYYYNDVPLQAKEYKSKIDAIINELTFKLVTNPLYFNSLDWKKQRDILEGIAGKISVEDLLKQIETPNNKSQVAALADILNRQMDIEEYRKSINNKKKIIKAELETLPTRINEAGRNKPKAEDWEMLTTAIETKTADIKNIDITIENNSADYNKKATENLQKQNSKNALERKLNELKASQGKQKTNALFTIDGQIYGNESDIKLHTQAIENNRALIANNERRIAVIELETSDLRKQATAINAEQPPVIDAKLLVCPTCALVGVTTPLPPNKIEETKNSILTGFNNDKVKRLNKVREQGLANNAEVARLKAANANAQAQIEELQAKIDACNIELALLRDKRKPIETAPESEPTAEMVEIEKQISAIVIEDIQPVNNDDLKQQKNALNNELTDYRLRLSVKGQIEAIDKRIAELEQQERTQAQEIANLEKQEFCIDAFVKAKVDTIEQRTNGLFSIVKFKMFEKQINGGISETCECMLGGVPYSNVNTGGKIQAGLDIIKTLSKFYNVYAPIFVDNRESVIEIPVMDTQIINLRCIYQKENERKLVIE